MSKTIEEMALEAYPVRLRRNKTGAEYDANVPRRKAFANGANAVLEEVRKALPFSVRYRYADEHIMKVIDRLKGISV